MSSDKKSSETTSTIGLSVVVETMDDGSELVGILVHTKDPENAIMIRMPPAQAKTLASNLDLAADSITFGDPKGAGFQ